MEEYAREEVIRALHQASRECTDDAEYAGILTAGQNILGISRAEVEDAIEETSASSPDKTRKDQYRWARELKTSDDDIERAINAFDEYDVSVATEVANQIISDSDDDSDKFLRMYQRATDYEKSVIDATLVNLTGWSLKSLLAKAGAI